MGKSETVLVGQVVEAAKRSTVSGRPGADWLAVTWKPPLALSSPSSSIVTICRHYNHPLLLLFVPLVPASPPPKDSADQKLSALGRASSPEAAWLHLRVPLEGKKFVFGLLFSA